MAVLARWKWSCGEADWLAEVGQAPDLKALLGYPLRFTARETLELAAAGITADRALAADPAATAADLLHDHASDLPLLWSADPIPGGAPVLEGQMPGQGASAELDP